MKKHLWILLTTLFMGFVFAFSFNNKVEAAAPAWDCVSSKGSVSLEGTCFFGVTNENETYKYIDVAVRNSDSSKKITSLYYKDIENKGFTKVNLQDGTNEYFFKIPVLAKSYDLQTIDVWYTLNNGKDTKLSILVVKETEAPVISFSSEQDLSQPSKEANIKVEVSDQRPDDSGLADVRVIWRKKILSNAVEKDFSKAENIIKDDSNWVTYYTSNMVFNEKKVHGEYQLCTYTKDFSGNVSISCSNSFIIDTLAPVISYGELQDLSKWYESYTVPFMVLAGADETVTVKCYVDGVAYDCSGKIVLDKNFLNGEHKVYVEATDGLGNTSRTDEIVVKTIGNLLTYVDSIEGTVVDNIYLDNVNYLIEIKNALKYEIYYSKNGAGWIKKVVSNDNKYIFYFEEDGINTIQIKVIDEAGRELITEEKAIEIDSLHPHFDFSVEEGADIWYGKDLSFDISIAEQHYEMTYSLDNKTYMPYNYEEVISYFLKGQGETIVHFKAKDRVGHIVYKALILNMDCKADEINATWNEGKVAANSNLQLDINVEVVGVNSPIKMISLTKESTNDKTVIDVSSNTTVFNLKVSENGKYIIEVTDTCNNTVSKAIEINNFFDFSDEYSIKYEIVNWTNESYHIYLEGKGNSEIKTAKVTKDGVEVEYNFDKDCFIVNENGKYLLAFENLAGYSHSTEVLVENIDIESDSLTINDNYDFDASLIEKYVFSVNVLANGKSPILKTVYGLFEKDEQIDESKFVEIELNKEIVISKLNGEYYLCVVSFDAAGNRTEEVTGILYMNHSNPVNGKILTNPGDNSQDEIEVSFEKFTHAIANVELTHFYRITKNNEEAGEFIVLDDLSKTIVLNEEGSYLVEFKAVKDADSETTVSKVVVIDRTAPIITIKDNSNDKAVKELNVEIEANEEVTLEYQISTLENAVEEDYIAIDGNNITITVSATGNYNLFIRAKDKTGNLGQATKEYFFDLESPVVSFKDLTTVYDKGQSIEFEAKDNDAVKEVRYILEQNITDTPDVSKGFVVSGESIVLPEIEDGKYFLYVSVEDNAGNVTIISKNIVLDSKAPVVKGVVNFGYYKEKVTLVFEDLTDYVVLANGKVVDTTNNSLEISENGYYYLSVTDLLGHSTIVSFVLNTTGKVQINDKSVDVTNQKYLPILKDEKGYYINLPAVSYPEKRILVFSKVTNEGIKTLDQDPNYLYLSSMVREDLSSGHRFAIEDLSCIMQDADAYGNYGYVVVNTMTLNSANILDINPIVIDDKVASLLTGLTGIISVLGIFIINRSRRLIRM